MENMLIHIIEQFAPICIDGDAGGLLTIAPAC